MPKNRLLILACASVKNPDTCENRSFRSDESHTAVEDLTEELRTSILNGRNAIKDALDPASKIPIPALDRYNGGMYRTKGFRQAVAQMVTEHYAKVLILSGYYGLVTPSERILNYEKSLDVDHWVQYRLPEAIGQLMKTWQISSAMAFLNARGPYRKILHAASLPNTKLSLIRESYDPQYVYPALGAAIVQYAQSEFNEKTLTEFNYDTDVGTLTVEVQDV
jgi:hypothetical protein